MNFLVSSEYEFSKRCGCLVGIFCSAVINELAITFSKVGENLEFMAKYRLTNLSFGKNILENLLFTKNIVYNFGKLANDALANIHFGNFLFAGKPSRPSFKDGRIFHKLALHSDNVVAELLQGATTDAVRTGGGVSHPPLWSLVHRGNESTNGAA